MKLIQFDLSDSNGIDTVSASPGSILINPEHVAAVRLSRGTVGESVIAMSNGSMVDVKHNTEFVRKALEGSIQPVKSK